MMYLIKRIRSRSIPSGLACRTDILAHEISGETVIQINQVFLTKDAPNHNQYLAYSKCGYNVVINSIAMKSETTYEVMKSLIELFTVKK